MMNEQGGKDIKWQFGLARNIIIVVSTRRPSRNAKKLAIMACENTPNVCLAGTRHL
jgi:hypothetical protein